ncbi:MAG: hypothetical protein JWM10_3489 [Myxococcaceae bacterium]|nr:hypothetical protein [Myxococcaceae bacterium]
MERARPWFGRMIGALLLAGCGSTASATEAPPMDAGFVDRSAPVDAGVATDDGLARPDLTVPDDAGVPAEDRPDVPVVEEVSGVTCATATELRDGDVLTGQRFGPAQSTIPLNCRGGSHPPWSTRWYRMTVPAGAIMAVGTSWEGDASSRFGVFVLPGCSGATECLGSTYDASDPPTVRYRNETGGPRTVVVGVLPVNRPDGTAETTTVSAHLLAPATNSTCATATPLTPGVTLRRQNLGTSTGSLRSCLDGSELPGTLALYYSITIPPRSALLAAVEYDTNYNHSITIQVRPPCGALGCMTGEITVSGDQTEYSNPTTTPLPVVVSLTWFTDRAPPVIDLTATLRPLPR